MRDDPFSPTAPGTEPAPDRAQRTNVARLRILATTDLHMQLLGHDDVSDRTLTHHGLAGLSSLITTAREEAQAQAALTLTLDNGDLMQGSALGDSLARRPVRADHPVLTCLKHIGYDALGLGNHDLDYGLDYLRALAARLDAPVISSNLRGPALAPLQSHHILTRAIAGTPPEFLRIGLLSLLPGQTALWNCHRLEPGISVSDPFETCASEVAALRRAGADLVIVMAHLGLTPSAADSATRLATIPGVDALITGHTHRRFPGPDHRALAGVDPEAGTVAGCPTVMAGFGASDLAVMDLTLSRETGAPWQIADQAVALRRNTMAIKPDRRIQSFAAPAHRQMRAVLQERVGETARDLHSYFSLLTPTPANALIAQAQAPVIRLALDGRAEGRLPLLVAVPAHTAGGRAGPHHYLNIPKGPVLRRHLTGLAPYNDQIWALRITGAGVRAWLERSAALYGPLEPDQKDQMLLASDEASFHFDTIYGLSYLIDPTRPAGERIVRLSREGVPIHDEQSFMLITTQFRAGSLPPGTADIIHRSDVSITKAIEVYLSQMDRAAAFPEIPWQLAPSSKVSALFDTSPDARAHLTSISFAAPKVVTETESGFLRLRVTLAPL